MDLKTLMTDADDFFDRQILAGEPEWEAEYSNTPDDTEDAEDGADEDDDDDTEAARVQAQASRINQLSDRVMQKVTNVAPVWLGGVKPHFDRLAALALSDKVSDADFIAALKKSSDQIPELFDDLDSKALADAFSEVSIAMLEGAEVEIKRSEAAG